MDANPTWRTWHQRFKDALDDYKARKNLTDADVAADLGISRASLTHWRAGRRTPEMANFFAACSHIEADPEYILFGRRQDTAPLLARRIERLSQHARDAVLMAIEGAELRDAAAKTSKAS